MHYDTGFGVRRLKNTEYSDLFERGLTTMCSFDGGDNEQGGEEVRQVI